MKYYLMLLSFLVFTNESFSQKKTETVEQYCIVKCFSFFSKDFKADFDFGDKYRPLFDWTTAKDSSGNVLKFKSEADVLNYLGRQEWKLVNAYPKGEDGYTKFIFKKKFLKPEMKEK